jgi:hypothetical protein
MATKPDLSLRACAAFMLKNMPNGGKVYFTPGRHSSGMEIKDRQQHPFRGRGINPLYASRANLLKVLA